ncbi:hypothetical protein FGO68_gene7862 [Halteria grandinella]|uniref:ABM domain-containing protein n=1 Tax=Halteria grandinella TaxID=5974 RepID=A0A8J8NI54_HALGN|nr:hypothetical protein FGO68_gene7862 [Halteria grandinella]
MNSTTKIIHVIARVTLKEGQREAYLKAFHNLVPLVRQESGCIEYGPAIDIATGIAGQLVNDNVMTVVEKWESLEHLRAHLEAPHMKEFAKENGHMREQRDLYVMESVQKDL